MKRVVSSNNLYISQSQIPNADRGVFANAHISKGEVIEVCPFIALSEHEIADLGESVLINYCYFFGEKKERCLVALGFGSLYNHLSTPNAMYQIKPEERIIEFIAIKDIAKDEEITVNYVPDNHQNIPLWFAE